MLNTLTSDPARRLRRERGHIGGEPRPRGRGEDPIAADSPRQPVAHGVCQCGPRWAIGGRRAPDGLLHRDPVTLVAGFLRLWAVVDAGQPASHRGESPQSRVRAPWAVDGALARFAGTRARLRRLPGCPPPGAPGPERALLAARRRGLGEARGRRRELPTACSSRQPSGPTRHLNRTDGYAGQYARNE